jgi:hypothetical protein
LHFGERARRHRRIRHATANDPNDIVVRTRCLERALTEIDPGNLVAIFAMATAAVRFVKFRAGVDVFLRVTVLLRDNRGCGNENSDYSD